MTEEQPYDVVDVFDEIELRRYPAAVLAQVQVQGGPDSAGTKAFRPLVGYIGGRNRSRPLTVEATGATPDAPEKIAMTAPVLQEASESDDGTWTVSFVLPAGRSLNEYPTPADARVNLVEVPEHEAVAIRWSGRWSYKVVQKKTQLLRDAISQRGWQAGEPRWARYDPPWQLPFRRRNEVIVPVFR